ncbi:MAG: Crp/Fnr family transcriptional regulator, partial [Gemmatimonadota bacterium]
VFVELPTPLSVRLLFERLNDADPGVRYHILKALNRLRRDHAELAFGAEPVSRALEREVARLREMQAIRAALHASAKPDGTRLWVRILREREDDAVERITRCLGLVYPLDEIFHAYRAMATGTQEGRARGIELLDNVLRPADRREIIPLLESVGAAPGRMAKHASAVGRLDPWLEACVTYASRKGPDDAGAETEDSEMEMMSIVERAEVLKDVPIFSFVRTDYLAKIAAVTPERTFAEGDRLFEQDGPPEALYLIVQGDVRLLRDGKEVGTAGAGGALGALAVLDRHPNPVTAVAAGPTRALRIEDEVLNDLMMDNPAILLGLVRFLAGEVRRLQTEPTAEPAIPS